MCYRFVWSNKSDKIKRVILSDIKSSMQVGNWTKDQARGNYCLNTKGGGPGFLFECNDSKLDINISNPFMDDVF